MDPEDFRKRKQRGARRGGADIGPADTQQKAGPARPLKALPAKSVKREKCLYCGHHICRACLCCSLPL